MTQLEKLMKLGMTEAEAKQVLEDDKRIDKGEKMDFDLTAEQEKATRKYRQADRKETVYKFQPRERKPNDAKREIIRAIKDLLYQLQADFEETDHPEYKINPENIEITNVERQIDFVSNGVRYRIVLSAPRK